MPDSSRSRKRKSKKPRRVPARRHSGKSSSGYTPGIRFTASEERWMAERLAAFDRAQANVPPEHREGNLPRAGSLPPGLEEDAPEPMRE